MARSRSQEIRREQKKSFYLSEISQFVARLVQDEPLFVSLCLTRAELSPDGHRCTIYGIAIADDSTDLAAREELFDTMLGKLILYTPSLRAALAKSLSSRYVPELRFGYDAQRVKQERIDSLLAQISNENKSTL